MGGNLIPKNQKTESRVMFEMSEIYLENMSYSKAIKVLNNIEYEDYEEEIIVSAIYKILKMATINAVTKDALVNAVKWLFNRCYEIKR